MFLFICKIICFSKYTSDGLYSIRKYSLNLIDSYSIYISKTKNILAGAKKNQQEKNEKNKI